MLWSSLTAHSRAVVMGPFDPSIILYVSNQEAKSKSSFLGGGQAGAVAAVNVKYANTAVIKGGRTYLQGGRRLLTHKSSRRFLCASPPLYREAFTCPARTACRELTRGTAGSVASCWLLTGVCTRTMPHWWRRFHSSSRPLSTQVRMW